MIRRLFRKYLLQILLSDIEIRRLLKQIVLTNIEKAKVSLKERKLIGRIRNEPLQ